MPERMSSEEFRRKFAKSTTGEDLVITKQQARPAKTDREQIRHALKGLRDYTLDLIDQGKPVTRKALDFYINQTTIKQ